MDADARDLFLLYLHDHVAAAVSGKELARRLASAEAETPLARPLELIAAEIEQDEASLRQIVQALGADDRAPAKEALAWVGEKLGRLKLNGRLVGRSPLSRVLELEALQSAVTGKLALWRTLQELRRSDPRLAGFDLTALLERARDQRERLAAMHDGAVQQAFGSAGGATS